MAKGRVAIVTEYAALRFVCALVNAIPYPIAMAFARGLAVLLFDVFRFKRSRTLRRLESVFPEKTPSERRTIARKSLANVLEIGVEMIRVSRFDRAWMDRNVIDGAKSSVRLKELLAEGRGAVIMVPHCGNWYMAAWAMAKYGAPLTAIAARQRNPLVHAWMHRQYGDIEVFDRRSRTTLLSIKDRIAAGRGFAILPDLRVRERDVEVDFLRGKANVSHGGAMFAVRSGAPVIVAAMSREGGRHRLTYLATLRPDTAAPNPVAEARRLTAEAMKLLGDFVLAHPGDWYWFNKRWILEPVH